MKIAGDLQEEVPEKDLEVFDDKLHQALLRFQYRHGLIEDGILGAETLSALNIPVEERVAQLELNRNLIYTQFDQYLNNYILINIPSYYLQVIESGQEIMRLKTIVGRPDRKTPVFDDKMEYIVLNPEWKIPRKMSVNDIIPKIKNDPSYLSKKNINVFNSWNNNAEKVNPAEIDWSSFNLNNFELMFKQEAGPENELGRLKFIFPNQYLVYIHDTPYKDLFNDRQRAYSSGCIRLENPLELAVYLLEDQVEWNRQNILKALETGETMEIELVNQIPVIITYWTSWVDSNNLIHFREDIYDIFQ